VANDIDMWNDIEEMDGRTKETKLLSECFYWRYNDYNIKKAEKLKQQFQDEYGY